MKITIKIPTGMLEDLEEYARNQGDAWDKSIVDGAIDIIKNYCRGDEE